MNFTGVFGFLKRLKKPQGSALIPVLIAAVCIGLLLGLGYYIVQNSIRTTNVELSLKGQVYNVATSGISESLSWFRSRRFQPVRRFEPKMSKDAVGGEKGLIRNFEVSKSAGLWGRFSVRPDLVEDITDLRGRGKKGDGLVWRVRSEGILFINHNPSIPYNKTPNKIIHRLVLMTEIQRLNISPPANSAILTENGSEIEILDGGRVRGFEGAALTFRQGTGRPNISIPTEVTSHRSNRINLASKTTYRLDIPHVFGVTWRELLELADILVDDTSMLPPELPRMAIVVMEKDAVFNHDRPLIGGGILIVDGNLQIEANSNSNFSGLIYCRGSFIMDAPALVSGTVISLGEVRLQGFGDFAEVQYNGDFLGFLKQRLGQYRQTQALIQVKG